MIAQPNTHESSLTQEWENVMLQVESRLASGVSRNHLIVVSGIRQDDLGALLERRKIGRRGESDDETGRAIGALKIWLADAAEAEAKLASGFAVTPTFQAIQGIIERARRGRRIVSIIGGVGVGKSEAAKAYAADNPRTHRQPGAVRVEFARGDDNLTAAYARILGALEGEKGRAYRSGEMRDAVAGLCRNGDVLLLDECNNLRDAAEMCRDLWALGVPVVMLGNPVYGKSVYGKGSTFDALASRALPHYFDVSTEDDVNAWLAWAGLGGVALRRAAVALACRPGANGGLRSLALLVDACRDYFPDKPIDAELLRAMAEQFRRPC